MSDPVWQLVKDPVSGAVDVVSRTWPDGAVESCLIAAPQYQAWLAAGNAPMPAPTPPAPVPACQLWQLQAVMTASQWSQVQSAVAAMNSPAVTAFFAHGTNTIPANSTTLLTLGAAIGLTVAQVTALVAQASAVSIP